MSSVKIVKLIQAPPSEVFVYFTNSTALKDWLCDVATADPRPGGRLYLWWNGDYYTSGEYINVEKDKLISFTWFGRREPHATRVDVILKKKKTGTLIRLVHKKIGKSQKWIGIGDEYEKEWSKGLENLASVLENGADMRITTRPMLGVYVSEFNASIAEGLHVPVNLGLRLGGTIEGLSAQKAGLMTDDVITGIDGNKITGNASLYTFITTKHAGDTIEVTFYRHSEKKTIKMTLSGRPIPPIPASGIELSKQVELIYQHFETEIEALLKDSNEEECAKKPAPSEWSANEVLAHLIQNELAWQINASEIIGGHEASYDDDGGNIQAHIDGTVATFPTKGKLLKELKTHDTETCHMLAHIPAEFLTHKGKFWKLVYQAHQNSYHLQTHLEQIQSAIQSAKNK